MNIFFYKRIVMIWLLLSMNGSTLPALAQKNDVSPILFSLASSLNSFQENSLCYFPLDSFIPLFERIALENDQISQNLQLQTLTSVQDLNTSFQKIMNEQNILSTEYSLPSSLLVEGRNAKNK